MSVCFYVFTMLITELYLKPSLCGTAKIQRMLHKMLLFASLWFYSNWLTKCCQYSSKFSFNYLLKNKVEISQKFRYLSYVYFSKDQCFKCTWLNGNGDNKKWITNGHSPINRAESINDILLFRQFKFHLLTHIKDWTVATGKRKNDY